VDNVVPVVVGDIFGCRRQAITEVVSGKLGMLVVKLEAELSEPTFFSKLIAYIEGLVRNGGTAVQ
jgi:hypothetical protein